MADTLNFADTLSLSLFLSLSLSYILGNRSEVEEETYNEQIDHPGETHHLTFK